MAFDTKRYDSAIENIIAENTAGPMTDIMRSAAEEIRKRIAAGEKITAAVSHVTGGLSESMKQAIEPALFQAACAGNGIWPEIVAKPNAVKAALLDTAWTKDRMKLSDRLHGTTEAMRNAIIDEIAAALKENESWTALSKRLYDGYGEKTVINPAKLPTYLQKLEKAARRAAADGHIDKAAMRTYLAQARKASQRINSMNQAGTTKGLQAGFKQLLDATTTLTGKRIDNAIMVACEERARYYADRIARTETARAWFDGFIAKHGDDTEVIGYRWVLASRHPSSDICDMHRNADFYGMGPGAYPKNSVPVYPSHPHCLCHLSAIFEGEAPHPQPFNPNAGDEYLKSAPDHIRKAILGVKGEKAWRAGKIGWQTAARKRGWAGHLDVPGRIKPDDLGPKPAKSFKPPQSAYKRDVQEWVDMGMPAIPQQIAEGTKKDPAAFTFMTWVRSGMPAQPGPDYEWTRIKGTKEGEWKQTGKATAVKTSAAVETWKDKVAKLSAQKNLNEKTVNKIGEIVLKEVETRREKIYSEQDGARQLEIEARIKELRSNAVYDKAIRENKQAAWEREMQALVDERDAIQKKRGAARKATQNIVTETLRECRTFGGATSHTMSRTTTTDMGAMMEKALQQYPKEWAERSLAECKSKSNMTLIRTNRGYYSHSKRTIAISSTGTQADDTMLHELGHRFERVVPRIRSLESEFYWRRVGNEQPTWLGRNYDKTEVSRRDNFLDAYMGKDYNGTAYELVSMGFQWVLGKFDGGVGINDLLAKDPDYLRFILGILAGV